MKKIIAGYLIGFLFLLFSIVSGAEVSGAEVSGTEQKPDSQSSDTEDSVSEAELLFKNICDKKFTYPKQNTLDELEKSRHKNLPAPDYSSLFSEVDLCRALSVSDTDKQAELEQLRKKDNILMQVQTTLEKRLSDAILLLAPGEKYRAYYSGIKNQLEEYISAIKDDRLLLVTEIVSHQSKSKESKVAKEYDVSSRLVSTYEFGLMKVPDYSKNENNGFNTNKGYFDMIMDGRFEFERVNTLLNTTITAQFMSSGALNTDDSSAEIGSEENDTSNQKPKKVNPEIKIPNDFNDVSDTLDANITFRLAANKCEPKSNDKSIGTWFAYNLTCLSASQNRQSSLGLIGIVGFQNREKKLPNGDSVNRYDGWGINYRLYDSAISRGNNISPSFTFTYAVVNFEEYGFNVVPTADHACTEILVDDCVQPIKNAKRRIINMNYRIHKNHPFYIGLRANLGKGQDDYGITVGIRKTAEEILGIFGYKAS